MIGKLVRIAKRIWRWRDAVTGRFMSRPDAEKRKDTTVKERVK